jgi:hypothetical protein
LSPLDMKAELALERSRAARMECLEAWAEAGALRSVSQKLRHEVRATAQRIHDLVLQATAMIADGPRRCFGMCGVIVADPLSVGMRGYASKHRRRSTVVDRRKHS